MLQLLKEKVPLFSAERIIFMSAINISDTPRLKLPQMAVSDRIYSEFKSELDLYVKNINKAISDNENEEHIKNIINDFLRRNFYSDKKYSINTDGNIDSAIKENDSLLAIIEAKSPQNKQEMPTCDNINKKALWESVYYFLERAVNISQSKAMISSYSELRRIIITDGLNWFLIDSSDIHAVTDGAIERRYLDYTNGKLPYKNDTPAFYDELRQRFDEMNIGERLDYVYFNIADCASKKQTAIKVCKMLSENYLIKNASRTYEPHSLNSRFYHELLYIMGLKESERDNKLYVEIDLSIKNSLAYQVYKLLEEKEMEEPEIIETAFELVVIWMNRLLFIKLFEGQLLSFNGNNPEYSILSEDKIKTFDDLQGLFFDVLGTKDRTESEFHDKFSKIPYLNSSLFEKQPVETDFAMINYLKNSEIARKPSSVLGAKSRHNLPILEYIIDFLNNYNFASDADDGGDSSKEIIDAAVLGLIFEKLNGYKDGANYTPSVITEYIAKEAIEQTVIKAVNVGMKWKCHSLSDIKDKIETKDERIKINGIINSLKICDPAVGSGHFLVSALNWIIAIKRQLGVLFKFGTDERVKDYSVSVEDDVLRVRDGEGNAFVYNKKSEESRQMQETLFHEKRIIIENCLFGVDINPKAVYICQLRLWIELLKNAYYKNGVMETLPNIDIKIKKGNSLLSKIDFAIGKKIKADKEDRILISQYKTLVEKYKSVSNKADKKALVKDLNEVRELVHGLYEQTSLFDKIDTTYDKAFEWAFEFPEILDENGKFLGFDVIIGNPPYIQLQKMKEEAARLKKMKYMTYSSMGDIYCLFYELAYKLLKTDGILAYVTSNKWMRAGYGENLRRFLSTSTDPVCLIDFAGEKVFDSATVDVNILIYVKRENKYSTDCCIISGSDWRKNLSVFVEQNKSTSKFDSSESWTILSPIEQSIKRKIEAAGKPLKDWNISINYGIKTGCNDAFIIDTAKKDELIAADPKSAEIIRPILRGKDIKRYAYSFTGKWIINVHNGIKDTGLARINIDDYPAVKAHLDNYYDRLEKRDDKGDTPYNLRNCAYMDDFSKQKIVWGEISDKPKFAIDVRGQFYPEATTFFMTGNHLKYLLCFFNSSLSEYYFAKYGTTTGVGTLRWKKYLIELLPIPAISKETESKFDALLDNLIGNNSADEHIISEINNAVYNLYDFDENEIKFMNQKILEGAH